MSVAEIIPNLWLGNIKIAKNKQFFDDNNISIVINCSRDIPFYSNYTNNIRISVNDNLKHNEIVRLYKYMDKSSNLIHKELLDNKSILVHCYAGVQRSASIIAAYLIKYGEMSLKTAILSIKSKRHNAFTPSVNFLEALIQFEKDIKLKLQQDNEN